MLTPAQIKCAIVMMSRAQCTGQEAADVADTMRELVKMHDLLTTPAAVRAVEETPNNDDAGTD